MANRKSTRLKGWDYSSPHAYHVTICTKNKAQILGTIDTKGHLTLSELGNHCRRAVEEMRTDDNSVCIDAYAIMPNHVHLLVRIETGGSSLSRIIAGFKARVTRHARNAGAPEAEIWQRGFYDHIIRGERDYISTIEYIEDNPRKWIEDRFYSNT